MAVPTADFDTYDNTHSIVSAEVEPGWVTVVWDDDHVSRFHHIWLRDNCPCSRCVYEITKEQTFELLTVPLAVAPISVTVGDGVLDVAWGGADAHRGAYDAGWLRAHCYSDVARAGRRVGRVPWDGTTLPEPPTFDGLAVLDDDEALYEWLVALRTYGCSRLRGVPCRDEAVGEVAARIGIVRDTNFGVLWDVRVESDPITNANTALPLPPHVDLPTREYQPGLQFLHCLENDAAGGESILVDGLRLAEVMRSEHPEHYEVLTCVRWNWANRSKTSDYRWTSPLIVTDSAGEVVEVRVGNWLRAPLVDVPFEEVEAAYAAYRYFFALSYEPRFQLRFRLEPGDLMAFDNRRMLHARGAFTDIGRRHLRGCYTERDELNSRIRMLERSQRTSL